MRDEGPDRRPGAAVARPDTGPARGCGSAVVLRRGDAGERRSSCACHPCPARHPSGWKERGQDLELALMSDGRSGWTRIPGCTATYVMRSDADPSWTDAARMHCPNAGRMGERERGEQSHVQIIMLDTGSPPPLSAEMTAERADTR